MRAGPLRDVRRVRDVSVVAAMALVAASAPVQAQRPEIVPELLRTTAVQRALDHARASEPETIADQIRICEVPAPPFEESARAELLRQAFVAVRLQNVRVDAIGNVLGDRPGRSPRPRLVLAAHLDTVFPAGTVTAVTRSGAVLRGPGIGDNCRGLAVLLATARALDAAAVTTAGTVTFVANVGEEGLGDLRGVKGLFADTLKGQVDRFVTIDNAGLSISTVAVGSLRYRMTFRGPGGHSFAEFGHPNPAQALARAVAAIAEFRVPSNPRTTFNVGRIGGGTSVNAIPSEAWMEIDLRSTESASLAALDTRVQRAVASAVSDENARAGQPGGIAVSIDLVGNRPAGATPVSAPIVRTAQAVARALNLQAVPGESSSDANLPISLGIPAITIGGGGVSAKSHAEDESFDTTDAWQGTQNAVLLTIALTGE